MKKILIVDDSKTTRQVLNFSLTDAGYSVTEAVDGLDAMQFLEKDQFDLMITDLKMPRMDGLELTQKVRASDQHRYMPVVILTTESADDKKQEGKAAGASCWIVKPFQPDQLLQVVNMSLEKK
jgi:two-component system chemotaxis response regulator CheY